MIGKRRRVEETYDAFLAVDVEFAAVLLCYASETRMRMSGQMANTHPRWWGCIVR